MPPRHASAAFAFNITLLQCENAPGEARHQLCGAALHHGHQFSFQLCGLPAAAHATLARLFIHPPRRPCPPVALTLPAPPADAKLAGLATFLTARKNFGGTLFISCVLNSTGHAQPPATPSSPAQALRLAGAALAGNTWFARTTTSSPLPCLDFYWVRPSSLGLGAVTPCRPGVQARRHSPCARSQAATGAAPPPPQKKKRTAKPARPPHTHTPRHPIPPESTALPRRPACPCPALPMQVVFAPKVAQVWVDNLADLWGNVNMLAADLFDRCGGNGC